MNMVNDSLWNQLPKKVEAKSNVLCKHLDCKELLTGMLHLYAAIHEIKESTVQEVAKETRNSTKKNDGSRIPQMTKLPKQRKLVHVYKIRGYSCGFSF
jgi:hypothetical protein